MIKLDFINAATVLNALRNDAASFLLTSRSMRSYSYLGLGYEKAFHNASK